MYTFYAKYGKDSVQLTFISVKKHHTKKLYILRHCTNLVYSLKYFCMCKSLFC